ncbi:hypothetical protein ADUPG1_013252 [Aduncisulcus paluster]|uniref:Ubiquitin-conjugating enzyme E2 Z n=1 Tax=Aduncisulcus paluster TaxID=2918883 RepID=A0ABQ5K6G0_9EUKA|nr:hypothetical protein ADUPG1_013252 [Aduncisulcus paluster]|eukprot:gnl/Carplike_NY0171/2646_a3556_669.p1 GENE.gnl/Carplike_NY0171/2646_a3556_669~~gnl/Carplike_NY0171/2646_a3556_669.p1  ORF type:complete len:261 (-),score=59.08 gnl/Carplike_NY0171/2646_a3556_669:179-961(-)
MHAKRIFHDLKSFQKEKFTDKFLLPDPEDFKKLYQLTIGPSGPYMGGFYFFEVDVPETYPFNPPSLIHSTRDGLVRFNPNLYVGGKVCLSVIGTWGNTWAPSHNFTTIFLSLQGHVFNWKALDNEPGSHFSASQTQLYDEYVAYNNIKIAVCDMWEKLPVKFCEFRPMMAKELVLYAEKYFYFYDKHVAPISSLSMSGILDCRETPVDKDLRKRLGKVILDASAYCKKLKLIKPGDKEEADKKWKEEKELMDKIYASEKK